VTLRHITHRVISTVSKIFHFVAEYASISGWK